MFRRAPRAIGIIDPTQGGKAGNKDPRQAIRGGMPYAQPDIAQIAQIRNETAGELTPQYRATIGAAPETIVASSSIGLQSIPWVVTTVVGFVPVLWVPRNPRRKGLIMANENVGTIHFTIGPPPLLSGTPIGYLISASNNPIYFFPAPTDDIFVFANAANPVIAYELFELPVAEQ